MRKIGKALIPLLSIPFVLSCSAGSITNNNDSNNTLTSVANDSCIVDIYCEDCYVGKGESVDDLLWQTSLNTSATVGEEISFYFKEKSKSTLPSDVYSIYETESHKPISDYTYVDEASYKKLTFVPNVSTTIEVVGAKEKDECAEITWNTTEENEKVAFSYNGGLNFVDWGDGTIDNELVHAYTDIGDHTAKIYGTINSISVGNKNPKSNLYSPGNKDIISVNLKNKITSIPASAFSNCERIEKLTISNSVTNIATHSLNGCNELKGIKISENNPNFKSFNGSDIVNLDNNTLIYSNSSNEIDDSVTAIGDFAYEGSDITTVTIKNNIKSIGEGAFKDCEHLNVVDMTECTTLPSIEDNPFKGSGLISIEVINEEVAQAMGKYWGEELAEKVSLVSTEDFQILPFEDGEIKLIGTWHEFRPYPHLPNEINLCVKNYADPTPTWSNPITCTYNIQTAGTVECTLAKVKANKPVRLQGLDYSHINFFGYYAFDSGDTINADSYWSFSCVDTLGNPMSYNVSGKIISIISTDPDMSGLYANFARLFTQDAEATKGLVDASRLIMPPYAHDGCYLEMFRNCATLVKPPELPADDLDKANDARFGYYRMFYNCKNLIYAPELPSTTLAPLCYYEMFRDCVSLVSAPSILPVTNFKDSYGNDITKCYYYMFAGCTSLKKTPILPATTLTDSCYRGMFNSCASLEEAPDLPADTLNSSCYAYMFYDCINLKSTPIMPVQIDELPSSCYSNMFNGCISLTNARSFYIPEYVGSSSFAYAFEHCTSLVYPPEFIYATETTGYASQSFCYAFAYCTSLIAAPILPTVNEGVKQAFAYMFRGASSLKFTVEPQIGGVDNVLILRISSSLDSRAVVLATAGMFVDTGSDPAISKLAPGTNYYYIPQ